MVQDGRSSPVHVAVETARVRPVPRWWRDAIAVTTLLSVLIVVGLWVSGRGLPLLALNRADQLTSLGRLSGLLAADLLLVQVFLMARVPVVERSYGHDDLARKHRLVGFWSFNLLILHIILITLGYTLADHRNVFGETWTILTSYAGMLIALAGTIALTVVTVTSVRVARRRLRYESWHLLHLYAYAGVGLAVPHQIWTGADFIAHPVARIYWWSAYATAAGAVVLFRLGLPIWRTLRHGISVTDVVRESHDVVTVRMGGRGLNRLPVQSGQFFIFRFLDGPGWSGGNPYSLSAAPRYDRIQITAKDLGDGSGRLAGLRPGTKVLLEGPYGKLTGQERVGAKVAMLASGIGITPMRALLEDLDYEPGNATLVYRARSEQDLIFRNELDQLARRRGITVHYLTGSRIPGRDSWLPDQAAHLSDSVAMLRLLPDIGATDIFICGPDAWMDAATRAALRAGAQRDRVHQERFTW
ncbi:MAG: oxidoreductase [Marmoricola sp.]|jgi:predicted ferric reductase|nr:oxidoreductase [Marmoricola sp.]